MAKKKKKEPNKQLMESRRDIKRKKILAHAQKIKEDLENLDVEKNLRKVEDDRKQIEKCEKELERLNNELSVLDFDYEEVQLRKLLYEKEARLQAEREKLLKDARNDWEAQKQKWAEYDLMYLTEIKRLRETCRELDKLRAEDVEHRRIAEEYNHKVMRDNEVSKRQFNQFIRDLYQICGYVTKDA